MCVNISGNEVLVRLGERGVLYKVSGLCKNQFTFSYHAGAAGQQWVTAAVGIKCCSCPLTVVLLSSVTSSVRWWPRNISPTLTSRVRPSTRRSGQFCFLPVSPAARCASQREHQDLMIIYDHVLILMDDDAALSASSQQLLVEANISTGDT